MSSEDTTNSQLHNEQPEEEVAASALTTLGEMGKDDDEFDEDFEIPQRFTKSGRKRAVPFPMKLMKVLSNKDFRHIIAWMPSGESFSIVKPKAFVADILPDHFKSAKYSSFTRKLHRWGFMRHYRGEEAGAFYHKDFKKDRLDLVEKMTCHKMEPPRAPTVVATAARKAQVAKPAEQPAPRVAVTPAAKPATKRVVPPRPAAAVAAPQQQAPEITMQKQLQNISKVPEIPQLDAAERLHAAIELEVNRRLKERIQAAALSRLGVMQLQQQPLTSLRGGLGWNSNAPGSLQAQLIQMQRQKQQFGLEAACLAFAGMPRMEVQGLEELPRTNIQGAKTA
jgi:hypothetical protein